MSGLDLLEDFPDTRILDLSPYYVDFVPFTANSAHPIHRWYRVKEGYSKDLVNLILGTLNSRPEVCLDLFAGSGTTPLVCQGVGIRCHSIEVNPFLHHLAKTKLVTQYSTEGFDAAISLVKASVSEIIHHDFEVPAMSTITQRGNRKKWLFNPPVLQALLALRSTFEKLEEPYSGLFLTILASVLTQVGNTTKDGKCVRYKNNWRENQLSREDVRDAFFERAKTFRDDIRFIEAYDWSVSNAGLCTRGSALEKLELLATDSIDVVVTSPPYLNSFDYTDVYMPELWVLGFVESYDDVKKLRASTLRSHVQVKWDVPDEQVDGKVRALIDEIVDGQESLWNESIPDMIGGYFLDMESVLGELKRILRPDGRLCLVVGTSSYYNVIVPTDLLIAHIAADHGFRFEEMRIMRRLKRSTQQTTKDGRRLPSLRETLLFLRA